MGKHLDGYRIAITGTLSKVRADIIRDIEKAGGSFCATVGKTTTHLVAANPYMSTVKFDKARAMGVEIVSESFLKTGKADKVFGADDRVEEEENADLRATYEYFDGHWKPYADDAHGIVEAAFKDWLSDKEVDSRPVRSGEFIYSVDFENWTQKNMQVPPHTVRQIRRCIGGVAQENVPSPKKAAFKAKMDKEEEKEEEPEEEEEEEKPKKRGAKKAAADKPKKRGRAKKDAEEDDEEDEEEDKPKKRAPPKPRASKKKKEQEEEEEEEEEETPKKKKAAAKAKASSKKKKQEEEEDEEDDEEKPTKGAAKAKPTAKKGKTGGGGSSVLDGLVFCITGKLSKPRAHFEGLIKANGGTMAKSLTKAVTHVLAADGDADTGKLGKARDNGVLVVKEEFLTDAIEDGEVPKVLDAYLLE